VGASRRGSARSISGKIDPQTIEASWAMSADGFEDRKDKDVGVERVSKRQVVDRLSIGVKV
jgi:hypothetical protein